MKVFLIADVSSLNKGCVDIRLDLEMVVELLVCMVPADTLIEQIAQLPGTKPQHPGVTCLILDLVEVWSLLR